MLSTKAQLLNKVTDPLPRLKNLITGDSYGAGVIAIGAWLLLLSGVFIFITGIVFSFGVFTHSEAFMGPFKHESNNSNALVIHLGNDLMFKSLLSTGGDSESAPRQSTLKLFVNSIPLNSAHALHDAIRKKGSVGEYSHWQEYVIFSFPEGLENLPSTKIITEYPLLVRPGVLISGFYLMISGALLLAIRLSKVNPSTLYSYSEVGVRIFGVMLRWGFYFTFCASMAFLASIAYGVTQGFFLPNTAIFALAPWSKSIALIEPSFAYFILGIAMLGALLSWAASIFPGTAENFRTEEKRLLTLFNRYGMLMVISIFLFSIGGIWAGITNTQDLSGNAIGGMVPFNDAFGHFVYSYSQAMDGTWDSFASRRPYAAALRTAGMFVSGYSNHIFLSLQATLLAIATFFAARSVMFWRGVWAGFSFLGLTIILVRPFLSANLTEPLGILLTLVSIPFIVYSIRFGSQSQIGLGLLYSFWALMIRMGNMFFLPAFSLWVIWKQRSNKQSLKKSLLVIAGIVALSVSLNSTLQKLYGSGSGATGSNFAYVFCGITHGGNWTRCVQLYAQDLKARKDDEAQVADFLYQRGIEKFINTPEVFFGRLAQGATEFLKKWRLKVMTGYGGSVPAIFPIGFWYFVASLGLIYTLIQRREAHELSFWVLFWVSLVTSASIVIFDDGWRVLCVSFPLIILMLSSGFTTPATYLRPISDVERKTRMASTLGWGGAIIIIVTMLILPWAAFKYDVLDARLLKAVRVEHGETLLLGTKYMSGFVVVSDDATLPHTVPAMHLASFIAIIKNSGIEQYQSVVTPLPPVTPFSVIAAPALNSSKGSLLIAPTDLLYKQSVPAWRVRLIGGPTWFNVESAIPVNLTPRTN